LLRKELLREAKMNTQEILFKNSAQIPEGLYVDLMKALKIDFDNKEKVDKVLIITNSLPRTISMTKKEMILSIIAKSVDWEDRQEVLLSLMSLHYHELKELCMTRRIATMKLNARWVHQQNLINSQNVDLQWLRTHASPGIVRLPPRNVPSNTT
jgi:hypothetical protein